VPGISVSGLVSGLDTDAIVSQLLAIERQPRSRLELRQVSATARQDSLRDISAKLRALETATRELRSPLMAGETQTLSVADATKLTATRTGTVAAGGYAVEVTRLAAADQRSWTWTPPTSDARLTIEGTQVDIPAGTSLDDAVKLIAAVDTGVAAGTFDGKLLLTAKATGAASTIQVTQEAFDAGTGTWVAGGPLSAETVRRAAQDAAITVDTVTYTDADGTFDAAVPGLSLTARALGSTAVDVGALAPDPTVAEGKLKAFVDAYNATIEAVRSRVSEKRVGNPQTSVDARKGVLFADTTLNGILSKLRATVSTTFASHPELGVGTAAATGTATSSDALAGKLTFDAAKFRETLAKDPTATRGLVADAGTAFGAVVEPLSTVGGLLDERIASSDRDLGRIKDSLERMDDRLERKEALYRAQFARLETALAATKAREADLSARLGLSAEG